MQDVANNVRAAAAPWPLYAHFDIILHGSLVSRTLYYSTLGVLSVGWGNIGSSRKRRKPITIRSQMLRAAESRGGGGKRRWEGKMVSIG